MSDIRQWLDQHGLSKYAEVFAENDVDLEVLPHLTEEHLEKLGVSLGHRVKMLKAIEELATQAATQAESAEVARHQAAPSGEAERRQLTVMFADLVGSTEFSQKFDPEVLREGNRAYQDAAKAIIEIYGGYVARYMGDGVLAYFGYPQAHEDDAERAIRAGLELADSVPGLETPMPLVVRVGIATGPVVVGDLIGEGASQESAVVGETPNLAARLQGVAEEDQLVIDSMTRHLIGTTFELEDLGLLDLKGFSEAVPVWRVIGESTAESRFEAAHDGTLTQLVGREHEVGLLCERWELAKGGEGQFVLLSGEAGIGKSRMVQDIREEIGDALHFRLRYQCSPHHTNSAFYPIIKRLERAAGFSTEDNDCAKLDKLETLLKSTTENVDAIAPLFAVLLSLPGEDRYGPLDMTPQQLRDRTIEALIDQVLALSRRRPVWFVVEDAHWIDPSTEDFLGEIMPRIANAAVFMLIDYRPEYTPPWTGHPHLTLVTLNRLSRKQAAEILQSVGGRKLTDAIVERIVARADGVPLYIEELTKAVLESGVSMNDPAANHQIPTTLQASLVARLDRLDEAKEIAQVGAIIGREFSYDLLAAVADETKAVINAALGRLVQSGMVFRRGVPPNTTYTFKQSLVQDAIYSTILISRRQQLHASIIEVLESQVGNQPIEKIGLLAHHAYQAEVWEKAFAYLREAGLKATNRSALREAVAQLKKALSTWSHLPETRETLEQAIDIRFDLRNALWSLGAFEEILAYLRDAERLAKTLDDSRRVGWVSVYTSASLWQIGRSAEARESAQAALTIAETLGDLALKVAGNFYLGCAYVTSGDCRRAETLFLTIAESLAGDLSRERCGLHFAPAVVSRSWLVWALAERGEFDEGIAHGQEAVRLAEELGHPFSRAHIDYDLGYLYGVKGDFDYAIDALEHALSLAREWSLTFMSPFIMGFLGHVYALSGRVTEGTSLLRQAVSGYESRGQGLFRSLVGVHLGEAFLLAHQVEDAFASTERALELARKRAERGHEAYALRLLGDIAAHSDPPDTETARHYREALTIAETLDMRPLVAHCHAGLGRLYRRQGKRPDADDHLARAVVIYRDTGMSFWQKQLNDRFGI